MFSVSQRRIEIEEAILGVNIKKKKLYNNVITLNRGAETISNTLRNDLLSNR